MADKPRLLIVGPRGLFGHEGGVEKFADSFVPRALEVAYISILCLERPLIPIPTGLQVVVVPTIRGLKTDKILYPVYAIFLHALRKFDHVLILGTNFAFLIPLLRSVFWRRSKIHVRSGSIDHASAKWGPLMRFFLRSTEKLCRYADTVIANAPNIHDHLLRLGIDSVVIGNGLDIPADDEFSNSRQGNTLIAVGRMTPAKNYSVLIEAMSALGERAPQLTIVGGDDCSEEGVRIKRLICDKDLRNCQVMGARNRDFVYSLLSEKALFVNCSTQEGMSNAVLEAIQKRIPIILSDIEANRDLDLDDHFYFPPYDPIALAEKIIDALSSPEKYVVRTGGFDDWETSVDRLLAVIGVKP